jgi:peptide/nickel transport system substrate-binding protein
MEEIQKPHNRKVSFPSWAQLRMLGKHLSAFEKKLLGLLAIVALSSSIIFLTLYVKYYAEKVPAYAGTYVEGVVGQPQFINPALADTNDVNRDIVELVFSGLMAYDNEGKLRLDLARDYRISEDGKIYTFYLREGIKWHDGETLTVDDIIFTAKTVQDPRVKSHLALNWQGVGMEKINDYTVQFILKQPYAPFLETLTMGILPQHIWGKITLENIALSEYNLKPIGSGPFKFLDYQKEASGKIISYRLAQNKDYYVRRPYINEIVFSFFDSEEALLDAANTGSLQGISPSSLSINSLKSIRGDIYYPYEIQSYNYFALFFNKEKNNLLDSIQVRKALLMATNKDEMVESALRKHASPANYPIPENLIPPPDDITPSPYSPEKAIQLLEADGWKLTEGPYRKKTIESKEKNKQKEEFVLTVEVVIPDIAELKEIGDILKNNWESVGIKTDIKLIAAKTKEGFQTLQQDVIRPRNYQILLFGHAFLSQPDLFSFWYSSQKKDPGLNFSLFENKEVDKLLEDIRKTTNEDQRIKKMQAVEKIIMEDVPAIFLYRPHYLYAAQKQIKGISIHNLVLPPQRFDDVINWYMATTYSF